MGVDASEVVVGANGRVLVAAADDVSESGMPDDVDSELSGDWTEVGYVSEDGITFKAGQTVDDIPAWQSFYPIRKVVTAKTAGCEFVMRQWNAFNLILAFGGGSIDDSTGDSVYIPAAPGELDERAICIEWVDGEDIYRLVFPRGMVTGEVSSNVVRTKAADLPISFEVTPEGEAESGDLSTQPWYLITNAFGS